MIKADKITKRLRAPITDEDPFVLAPTPDLDELEKSGSASVDLRLGTWFLTMRNSRTSFFDVAREGQFENEAAFVKLHYAPMGDKVILHSFLFSSRRHS